MRSDWKTIIVVFLLLFMFCAKPKSKWLKWQESLDLAYPNELSFKIDMQKKNFGMVKAGTGNRIIILQNLNFLVIADIMI